MLSRHADGVVVGLLVTGGAAQAGRAESVSAAPGRRLVQRTELTLQWPVARRVAIHAARVLEDLPGLGEQCGRALGSVTDGGEGARGPELATGLGLYGGRCESGAHGGDAERDSRDEHYATRFPAPVHDRDLCPAASRANGSRRTRWPVRWNRALATAGAMGGTPGSPTPVGGSADGTM